MAKKLIRGCLLVLILVGAAGAVAGQFARSQTPEKADARILPVTTVQLVAVERYELHRTYTGTIVAGRNSQLSFELGGEIVAVHVDQGDRVEPGDLLAELDTKSLDAGRRELVAQRASAQATLDELEAGARAETIAAARSEVKNFEAQVKLQELTLKRRETLINQRAVSKAEFDQATYGLQSANALLEAAQQRLAELLAGPREEKKRAQRAAVEQLDAAIAAVDVQLENSQITAPFRGTITARMVDEGAVIAAGQNVLRVIEDTSLEAWFGIPVAAAVQIQPGTSRAITVNGQQFEGTVRAVIPELDPATRTRRVVLELAHDSARRVYPGEIARWNLASEVTTAPSFWLPTTALVRGGRGMWSCFAVIPEQRDGEAAASGRVEKRDVRVVHTAGERVLVRGMLDSGEQLVAEGVHRVVPGQVVQIEAKARP